MTTTALIVGNSDGIGLAVTRRLLDRGWHVTGVSRSVSPVGHAYYTHHVADVSRDDFMEVLRKQLEAGVPDLFIYSAGIGELCDPRSMEHEVRVIEVNLMGLVRALSLVAPAMVERGSGYIIGISSLADELLSAEAPSYHASKAGFTSYLGSLNLALKPHGVHVTAIRFGFVDTKMAKGDVKPLMMSVERAVRHIERCIERKPALYTAPRPAVPLVKFRKWMMRLSR